MPYYIGIMSGTSLDGVDVAIVDFSGTTVCHLIAAKTFAFSEEFRTDLITLMTEPQCHIQKLGQLDIALGQFIAQIILQFLSENAITPDMISAIGSHGQTLFHSPNSDKPFSLQIGNANIIAETTGITTIADFRQRDIAAGGQGAPLVPAFHAELFADPKQARAIVNIGGIANITRLDPRQPILGFDTGPGNGLMDAWIAQQQQQPYDDGGRWAASGLCHQGLLAQMLGDAYFQQSLPKSTGREYFNLLWLTEQLKHLGQSVSPVDIQATLLELTACTISRDIQRYCDRIDAVYICGGGVHNHILMQRLQQLLNDKIVADTTHLGLHPDWVEATAFAWLAYRTSNGQTGNLPSVTGAKHPVILGATYPA